MIPVKPRPEPEDFFEKVRRPGEQFLAKVSHPTATEWTKKCYWRRALDQLYEAYSGICAYSCHWIPPDTGAKSVDHFKPKETYPQEAYRWENYRLMCGILNGRKGKFEDVLDPFTLQEGWFIIDFHKHLCKVLPSPDISSANAKRVIDTIERLKLNDKGTCLRSRVKWLQDYVEVPFPLSYLEKNAPFLASELKRQDLVESIREIMRY